MLFSIFINISLLLFQMSALQTWLLYHNALSTGVAIEDILKYARSSKDKAREESNKEENAAVILELKRQLAAQEAQIQLLMMRSQRSSSMEGGKPFQSDTTPLIIDAPQLRMDFDPKVGSASVPPPPLVRQSSSGSSSRQAAGPSTTAIPIAALEARESPRTAPKRPKTPNAIRSGDLSKTSEPPGVVASKVASKIALPRSGSKITDTSGDEPPSPVGDFLFKQPDTLPPREAPPQFDPSGTSPLAVAANAEAQEESDRDRSGRRKV